MKKEIDEYWKCVIGPVKRSDIPFGGDACIRTPVHVAFRKTFNKEAKMCSSGWGKDSSGNEIPYEVLIEGKKKAALIKRTKYNNQELIDNLTKHAETFCSIKTTKGTVNIEYLAGIEMICNSYTNHKLNKGKNEQI